MSGAKKRLFVGIVLDASGSMSHLRYDVVEQCNATLKTLREESKLHGLETIVTVVKFFDSFTSVLVNPINVLDFNGMTPGQYYPSGGTPLLDGVADTIDLLATQTHAHYKRSSFLVVTLTDGEENTSRKTTATSLAARVKQLQATDRWTFAFQVPHGQRTALTRLGIPAGNIREWEQTTEGLYATTQSTNIGTRSFVQAVANSAQGMSVASFYVNTDLSKLGAKQVHAKLDDISDRFKLYEVAKESPVKAFVEAKLKRPYVIGQAYYQLMKAEKVQPQKAVLIVEKGKQAVWGGQQARDLIGLPKGVDAKVTPGNHANYDIFVQSTSTNRKLPRGTKVLVDKTLSTALPPTWGAP